MFPAAAVQYSFGTGRKAAGPPGSRAAVGFQDHPLIDVPGGRAERFSQSGAAGRLVGKPDRLAQLTKLLLCWPSMTMRLIQTSGRNSVLPTKRSCLYCSAFFKSLGGSQSSSSSGTFDPAYSHHPAGSAFPGSIRFCRSKGQKPAVPSDIPVTAIIHIEAWNTHQVVEVGPPPITPGMPAGLKHPPSGQTAKRCYLGRHKGCSGRRFSVCSS